MCVGHGVDFVCLTKAGDLVGKSGGQALLERAAASMDANNSALLSIHQPRTGKVSTWSYIWQDSGFFEQVYGGVSLPNVDWCEQVFGTWNVSYDTWTNEDESLEVMPPQPFLLPEWVRQHAQHIRTNGIKPNSELERVGLPVRRYLPEIGYFTASFVHAAVVLQLDPTYPTIASRAVYKESFVTLPDVRYHFYFRHTEII